MSRTQRPTPSPSSHSSPMVLVRATNSEVYGFLGLQLTGQILLPILLLTLVFSKSIVRHRESTLINLCLIASLSTVPSLLLWYTGDHLPQSPEPNRTYCIIHAALVTALPPCLATAFLAVVVHYLLIVRSVFRRSLRPRRMTAKTVLLLVAPYIVYMGFATATGVIGAMNPRAVNRRNAAFFCSVLSPTLGLAVFSVAIITVVLTAGVQMWIGAILYRNREALRASSRTTRQDSLDVQMIIRVAILTLLALVITSAGLCIILLPQNPGPYIVQATTPVLIFLTFGTQQDVIQAWTSWIPSLLCRRSKPKGGPHLPGPGGGDKLDRHWNATGTVLMDATQLSLTTTFVSGPEDQKYGMSSNIYGYGSSKDVEVVSPDRIRHPSLHPPLPSTVTFDTPPILPARSQRTSTQSMFSRIAPPPLKHLRSISDTRGRRSSALRTADSDESFRSSAVTPPLIPPTTYSTASPPSPLLPPPLPAVLDSRTPPRSPIRLLQSLPQPTPPPTGPLPLPPAASLPPGPIGPSRFVEGIPAPVSQRAPIVVLAHPMPAALRLKRNQSTPALRTSQAEAEEILAQMASTRWPPPLPQELASRRRPSESSSLSSHSSSSSSLSGSRLKPSGPRSPPEWV